MVAKLERGINVSEEVYEFLVKESGYASLQEAERSLGKRRGSAWPA
jgi:predicted CopG family antitoxin